MLLLATASVTNSRQIEDILKDAESHPNSVYSQINKHSNNKALRIFYQTGVSVKLPTKPLNLLHLIDKEVQR